MSDEDDWTEPENGITLGPEEILSREIEKSKSLKVERLKLKDEIEKLRAKNTHLTRKNQALAEEIKTARSTSHQDGAPFHPKSPMPQSPTGPSPRWSLFLLIFNSCALGILLYFLLQK